MASKGLGYRQAGAPNRITKWFRNFLMGRPLEEKPWLRSPKDVASRSPNPPNIPEGPAHKLSANYYYSRDTRREMLPPVLAPSLKHLTDGERSNNVTSEEVAYPELTTPPVPGVGHRWTEEQS